MSIATSDKDSASPAEKCIMDDYSVSSFSKCTMSTTTSATSDNDPSFTLEESRLSTATSENNSSLPYFRSIVCMQLLAIMIALPALVNLGWIQRQAILRLVAGLFGSQGMGLPEKSSPFYREFCVSDG